MCSSPGKNNILTQIHLLIVAALSYKYRLEVVNHTEDFIFKDGISKNNYDIRIAFYSGTTLNNNAMCIVIYIQTILIN